MHAGYPEAYFGRLPLPAEAVMAVVAACRSDDVYHQVLCCKISPWLLCMQGAECLPPP